eukprot:1593404-Pleurochrysis_carterae.AAC.1
MVMAAQRAVTLSIIESVVQFIVRLVGEACASSGARDCECTAGVGRSWEAARAATCALSEASSARSFSRCSRSTRSSS